MSFFALKDSGYMIEQEVIDVQNGFDILLPKNDHKNYIKPNYINETTINILNTHLKNVCKKVVIEFPYYDRDYLSNYYGHWSARFKKFSKKSYRLLFFADDQLEDILGYVTLNPTFSKGHIGRLFFSPNSFVEDGAKLILSNFKIHTGGQDEVVEYFPLLCQLDPCVCAHVAAWSVTKFKSNWKEYADKTSYEIKDSSSSNWSNLSSSRGITVSQIAEILEKQGNTPILKHINNTYASFDLFEEAIAYIQSRIPVIITIDKHEHAVVGIGYGKCHNTEEVFKKLKEYDSIISLNRTSLNNAFLYPASYFVNSIYVNDDLSFPYKQVDSLFHSRMAGISQKTSDGLDYYAYDFSGLIIPLYHRINLNYDFAKEAFFSLFETAYSSYGWGEGGDGCDLIYNIFLTSANTFREQIYKVLRSDPNNPYNYMLKVFTKLELPRFVWIAEVASISSFAQEKINGFVVMDSTTSFNDPSIVLAAIGDKQCSFYDNGSNYEQSLLGFGVPFQIPSISANLTIVQN